MNNNYSPTCKLRLAGTIAVALLAGLGLAPAAAQQPAPVTIEVSRCVDLKAPGERLDCFEREVAAQRSAAPPAQPAPAAAPPGAAPPAPTTPAATAPAARPAAAPPVAEPRQETIRAATPAPPTVNERRSSRTDSREQAAAARAALAFTATVTELRETVPNTYLITLDNGQIWRQVQPKFYPLREGYAVQLTATHWGDAYRLTATELRGFIQVERVR
jgi:hypothetical protein